MTLKSLIKNMLGMRGDDGMNAGQRLMHKQQLKHDRVIADQEAIKVWIAAQELALRRENPTMHR